MRAIVRALEAGQIGEVQHIHGYGKAYYGGYDLMNIGTHMINMILKVAGPCRAISATAKTGGGNITRDDVLHSPLGMGTIVGERLSAILEFDGGVTATLLNHRYPERVPPMIEICGSEGRLMLASLLYGEDRGGVMYLPTPYFLPGQEWQKLEAVLPEGFDPNGPADVEDYWFAEEYVTALDEDRDHECSGAAGLHVVEIMMGLFESAAYDARSAFRRRIAHIPCCAGGRRKGWVPRIPCHDHYPDWLDAEDERLAARASTRVG